MASAGDVVSTTERERFGNAGIRIGPASQKGSHQIQLARFHGEVERRLAKTVGAARVGTAFEQQDGQPFVAAR